jgi:hypothetical protein
MAPSTRRALPPRFGSYTGGVVVAVASATYAAVLSVLSPGYQAGADSHYHFSVAREMARGTLVPDVARGLPFTVLHDMPVDHYWGYHLLLAPFALASDPEVGMKVATVVLFAAIFVAFYALLRRLGVAHAWAWALIPGLFSTQDWRYLQLRGGQLVLPLLFAQAAVVLFEDRAPRRRWLLLAIGYVGMVSYHGALVLLPFHVAAVLAVAVLKPSDLRRGELFEPLLTAAGLALGLTINPYMDRHASTWRFAAFHVGDMGRDTAHLYDDQLIAEFHGFPPDVLFEHAEWGVLLGATIIALALVVWRARGTEKTPVSRETVVIAGMTAAGIVLTAQAMRTREYAVPIAFALFATLAPKEDRAGRSWSSPIVAAVAACLLVPLAVAHGETTLPLIASHLPTNEYRGALPVLEANGDRPILNMAEADYGMLRWQYPDVVCVQALSRYFIYPYPELFHDVWELHDHADTSPEAPAILARFWSRGVRLVAAHRTNAMARYAAERPDVLRPVFRSPINGATIYAINEAALEASLQ